MNSKTSISQHFSLHNSKLFTRNTSHRAILNYSQVRLLTIQFWTVYTQHFSLHNSELFTDKTSHYTILNCLHATLLTTQFWTIHRWEISLHNSELFTGKISHCTLHTSHCTLLNYSQLILLSLGLLTVSAWWEFHLIRWYFPLHSFELSTHNTSNYLDKSF